MRGKYFDGLVIMRSDNNFVVQWGDQLLIYEKKLGGWQEDAHRGVRSQRGVPFIALPEIRTAPDRFRFRLLARARQGGWHCVARALCSTVGALVADTDANSGGGPSSTSVSGHVPRQLIATSRSSGVSCTAWSCSQ